MKLITKELEKKFEKYPLGSQDGLMGNAKVVAKFFNPAGAGTWLITEGNKLENGDYEMFGYCHLGDDECAEFGYVYLSELEQLRLPFGLKIERDLYIDKNITILEAMKQNGITPPDYMFNKEDDEIETAYCDNVTSVKDLNNNDSFTVARVVDNKRCVELHYDKGKATVEYGTEVIPGQWDNEIHDADWFSLKMSDEEVIDKLNELFKINFEDYYEM